MPFPFAVFVRTLVLLYLFDTLVVSAAPLAVRSLAALFPAKKALRHGNTTPQKACVHATAPATYCLPMCLAGGCDVAPGERAGDVHDAMRDGVQQQQQQPVDDPPQKNNDSWFHLFDNYNDDDDDVAPGPLDWGWQALL